MGKKSTNAEKQFRVRTVYGQLCKGWSRTQIVQFCADEWGISERNSDNYIKDARVFIDKDCSLTRQQFLAEALDRLRTYEQQAANSNQPGVAIATVRLQAELIGLTQK